MRAASASFCASSAALRAASDLEVGLAEGLDDGLALGLEEGLDDGLALGLEEGLDDGLALGLDEGCAVVGCDAVALDLPSNKPEGVAG